ncbi:cyanophycinase [Sphingomonas sp. KC8]|uniref:cyanophycinase n=1 Tax=Sphingomonas sp. KC8 TaxID=1030157 RepID=UPI00031DF077|nr:cyanophycinase [Sphingomonas sp. KC8]ARS26678.1 isoaspartyl aminopeptidase [Sphingomonas sp. KC8]
MRRPISIWALLIAIFGFAIISAPALAKKPPYRHHQLGTPGTPTPGPVSGGLLLIGGGDRNHDAMHWFFGKAGHGHIVVLRASLGPEIGEEFFNDIGGIQSVETFVFYDRIAATDPKILASLRRADGIFIAGGDQARYVRYWRGTPVAALLDEHVAAGKPLAGTSAGLAILGERLYAPMQGGSLSSSRALAAPFGAANTIEGDFLHIALLKGVVTDTHFKERHRLGRLFAFVAKAQADRKADQPAMIGLGVDESAALAVEPDGAGRIYATEPDGGVWLVDGAELRNVARQGPLNAPRVKVTRLLTGSTIHLPSGTVENPDFIGTYSAENGELNQLTY